MMRRIASQLAALLMGGRRGGPVNDLDPSQGGFRLEWNRSRRGDQSGRPAGGLSWTFQSAPVASRIFKIDEAQLRTARAAHDAGESWESISRSVNVEYDSLSPIEQEFYRRALEMAVDQDPASGTERVQDTSER
jgi:hypothetical protein